MTLRAKASAIDSSQPIDLVKVNPSAEKRSIFWEARTRILAWYVVLMTFFVGVSIPVFYELVFYQVDQRVREDLEEEVEVFQEYVREQTAIRNDVAAIFDRFLSNELLEDDNFLIAFIDGRFYKASSPALPEPLRQDSTLLKRWSHLTQPLRGKKETSDNRIGTILYIAEPVKISGQVRGVVVAAHTTAGERQEVADTVVTVILVLLAVLVLAVVLAWSASGRVLTPLRSLVQTARSISETDLTQRIPVQGSGELAELASTFNGMMDRIETAFASQRDFINDAAHELRTPITIIRGHLELLDDDPEEQQETLELVIDELDRMSRFVDDLILLAKTERGDFLKLETIDVDVLTEELYAKTKGLAHRNWQLQTKGTGHIVADRQRITQAIMNLAQNATHHTTETDAIALGSTVDRNNVRFWVRDTGEGINESDQQRIFERFARAANSRRRSEGAGLGLSIVRAIAQAHGGWVELFSRLGVGSTFTIVLPLETPKQRSSHESHTHRRR